MENNKEESVMAHNVGVVVEDIQSGDKKKYTHKFLVHHVGDHVGVAIEDIQAGEKVEGVIMENDSSIFVESKEFIPLGHKIALVDLKKGEKVIEYRVQIGVATEDIQAGDYVHTHNIKTARWDYE
jgi:(2R)-sulfolactate sulfo-lyase subunit alpha